MDKGGGDLADRRAGILRLAATWAHAIRSAFPERQILVRDNGRIHSFRLGTLQQVTITGVIAGCVLWALLSTAAYVDGSAKLSSKEDEVAQKMAELDGLKANYQAAFSRLDEFQTLFAGITCEVTDIQDSLLRIAEHNAGAAKRPVAAAPLPRLQQDPNGCRAIAADQMPSPAAAQGIADTPRIIGSLKEDSSAEQEALRRRVDQLERSLEKLKASHGAFLQSSAGLAEKRIAELEKTLASVGVDAQKIHAAGQPGPKTAPFGRGGPFIAAKPNEKAPPGADFDPVALFNNHADRLDNLTAVLRDLPLSEPVADYEITSPFGARRDPINNLTGIHEGVDLGAPVGTPVSAPGAARVVYAGWRDRYGMMVELDHGMNVHTRYGHLSKIMVTVGQHVARGATIGLVGMTGRTTGPHLHYEVRVADQPTNPMKFITAGQHVLQIQ